MGRARALGIISDLSKIIVCVCFFFNTEFNNVILASLELAIEQAGTTEGHMPLPPKCQD